MPKTLRVLHVEDQERDVALLTRHLSRAGYHLLSERVDTAAAMKAALETKEWDVILCDYSMPQFSAAAALTLLTEVVLDIPFIVISGTVGEAVAVEAMRAGAHDYLMKENLVRLAPIIERELQERNNRRARRLAEATLRESEDRYRDLVEHSHDLICTHDLEGRLLSVNQSAATALGYDRNDLLGRDIRGALLPEFRAGFGDYLAELQKAGIAHGTMAVLTRSGEKRVWEYTNTLRTEGVDVPIVRGVAHDVTEQKAAEKALRQSEEQYRILFDSNPLPMWVYDLETLKFLAVNEAAIAHYGYSREEFLAMTIRDIRPADDLPALINNIRNVKGGLDRAGSWRHQKKDGDLIDVEITSHSIDFTGRPAEIVLANDVTKRKQVEQQLRLQSAALESAANAILITDAGGTIEWVNPAFTVTTGYSSEQALGKTPRLLKSGKQDRKFYQEMWETILAGKVWHKTVINRRKDGDFIHQVLTITPIPDVAGKVTHFIGIGQDISDLKRTEQILQETNQRLGRALTDLRGKSEELAGMTQQLWQASKLATMGELAASIAHELNNPLAIVGLRTESLMAQLPRDDPQFHALEVIAQEVERMGGLVGNLLQFSRRNHSQISTLDLREELTKSLEFVDYHLRRHKIRVELDFAKILPTVQADRQQLRQVFLNLLTNASDGMPGGGVLTLRAFPGVTADGAAAVVLEFSDTGIGIEPDDLQKIWEPFFTTKAEGKGTGLGLSICRRTIEEHRGTIAIESSLGKGTTVRTVLPATTEEVIAQDA